MKKLFYSTLLATTLLMPTTNISAAQQVTVLVDGEKVIYDKQPIIQNGSTLVPLRKTFEVLGADVDWNANTQTVTSTKDDTTVSLTIGSNRAYKNGNGFDISVTPIIIDGRTYVPLRFVAESFGANVSWDQATSSVSIISTPTELVNNTIDLSSIYSNMTQNEADLFSLIHKDALDAYMVNSAIDAINANYTITIVEPETDKNTLDNKDLSTTPTYNSDLDGITGGAITPSIPSYDYVNNPWINKSDLVFYFGVDFVWLGEKIIFDKYGTTIYTLTGSPKSTFETDKIYTSDGINYKYDGVIFFEYQDLVTKGIIK